MRRGSFVCFSGLDGSGKTTLAKGVAQDLAGQSTNTEYVYARFQPRLMKPIIALAGSTILRKEDFFSDYSNYSVSKTSYSKKHQILSRIYMAGLLIDYALQVFIKIRMPLLAGRNIICDRYFFDTIATDLAVDFNLTRSQIRGFLEEWTLLFPKPNLTFFVDLPEEIAFARKNDIPSVQYLRDRRWVYDFISKSEGMTTLDGTKLPEILRNEAIESIRGAGLCAK